VDVVGPDPLDDPVGLQHRAHLRLDAREVQGDAVGRGQVVELADPRRPLRVDEVDAPEIQHQGAALVGRQRADAFL
jgi:hypothetical protein